MEDGQEGSETGDQLVGDLVSQGKMITCRDKEVITEMENFSYFYYSFI